MQNTPLSTILVPEMELRHFFFSRLERCWPHNTCNCFCWKYIFIDECFIFIIKDFNEGNFGCCVLYHFHSFIKYCFLVSSKSLLLMKSKLKNTWSSGLCKSLSLSLSLSLSHFSEDVDKTSIGTYLMTLHEQLTTETHSCPTEWKRLCYSIL